MSWVLCQVEPLCKHTGISRPYNPSGRTKAPLVIQVVRKRAINLPGKYTSNIRVTAVATRSRTADDADIYNRDIPVSDKVPRNSISMGKVYELSVVMKGTVNLIPERELSGNDGARQYTSPVVALCRASPQHVSASSLTRLTHSRPQGS